MANQHAEAAVAWQAKRRAFKKRRRMAIILLILLCALLCVLSFTVLFRMEQVSVSGMEQYNGDYVCRIADIKAGDSLLMMRTDALRERLLSNTLDADQVEVKRRLPSTLEVTFTPALPTVSIKGSGGTYYILSAGYRVLETGALAPAEGTTVLHGFTLTDEAVPVGGFASFQENDILSQLQNALNACGLSGVTAIDVRDRNNIRLLCQQNLVLDLGTADELDYKLGFIKDCMDKGRVDAVAIGCADAGETGKIYYRTLGDDPELANTISELLAAEDTARKAQIEAEAAASQPEAADEPAASPPDTAEE